MSRSPAQVKQWYADTHGISAEEAAVAIAYRSAFQQTFNDKVGSSQFHKTLEVQAGSGAKTVSFLTQIVGGLTSFFGGGLIGVAGSAAVELDKQNRTETLARLSELQPAVESCGGRLQDFTEGMAEDFTVMSLRNISGLNKEGAAELARKDAGLLIRQIADGKFDDAINNSQVIGVGNKEDEEKQALGSLGKLMVESVAQAKGLNHQQEESLMKARVAARNAGEERGGEGVGEKAAKAALVERYTHHPAHQDNVQQH